MSRSIICANLVTSQMHRRGSLSLLQMKSLTIKYNFVSQKTCGRHNRFNSSPLIKEESGAQLLFHSLEDNLIKKRCLYYARDRKAEVMVAGEHYGSGDG